MTLRTFLVTLIVFLAVGVIPSPAHAQSSQQIKPFTQNANSRIWRSVHIARKYWATRGFTCPQPYPDVFMTNDPPPSDNPFDVIFGWAEVYVDPETELIVPCDGTITITVWNRKKSFLRPHQECEVVIHEMGHWYGLDHMDEYEYPIMTAEDLTQPRECHHLKPRQRRT